MSIYPPTPPRNNAGVAVMVPLPKTTAPAAAPATPPPAANVQIAYPPDAVNVAQAPGSILTATWTAPAIDGTHSGATSYNLQYSPAGANTWTLVQGVTSPYTLSGTIPGAAIDVQMQSVNQAGLSPWTATVTQSTLIAAPNTPAGASVAQGTGSNLIVSWTVPLADSAHGAASGFNLRYSPSGAGTWTTVAGITSPYTLPSLTPGQAYDIQVESSNAAGTSAWSTITTIAPAIVAPNTPTGLALVQGLSTDLLVTWIASANDSMHGPATSYNLRSSPSGAGTWTVVTAVTSPYDLTGLTAGAAIDVQVQAANAAGTSAWSATSTLTTAVPSGPFAPNAPAITSVAPLSDGTVTKLAIVWTTPATDGTHGPASGYNLRYSVSGAGSWTTVAGVSSPYTLTGLTGATAYDIEVEATNTAASPSPWSGITTGKTWGATIAPGNWTAAAAQAHGAAVAPNGGVQVVVLAAPTAVTGAAFGWSPSASTIPSTGLIAGGADGTTNGWGQYLNAPATAGTYYLWMLAQGAGGANIGALVSSAITVS